MWCGVYHRVEKVLGAPWRASLDQLDCVLRVLRAG
jgi:hypothetical protein